MDKLQKLVAALPSDIDGALITSPINRRYYTGFSSSAGLLLVTRGKNYFLTDSRYHEAAGKVINNCEVILRGDKPVGELLELMRKIGIKSLGVESAHLSLKDFAKYQKDLVGIKLTPNDNVSEVISAQRQIKSQIELDAMATAQKIADKAFDHILGFISPGKTEKEIALELEIFIRSRSEGASFSLIVVSGANSSLPHGVASDKKIEKGDIIIIDFGAQIDGRKSDMTRTVAVGSVSDKQRRVYETVLEAQLAALAKVKAGETCSKVDKVARDIIENKDKGAYKGCFGHALGHSIGLEIHEPPRFSALCADILKPDMVLTVEPGIYLPGEFGVRIEDMVAITKDGIVNFTTSRKDLIVL